MDEIIVTTPEKIKQIFESCLIDFLEKNMRKEKSDKETSAADNDFLKSIKDIARFLGCSCTTAQRIKNQHQDIFIRIGRKFMVSKTELIKVLKAKPIVMLDGKHQYPNIRKR
jgi:quinolinate synthase